MFPNIPNIKYSKKKMIDSENVKRLFDSVGWGQGLTPDTLQCVLFRSSHAISAWDGKKLVGFIRSMDDDIYSANIDLLLVHKDYWNRGIATEMIRRLMLSLSHIQHISTSPKNKMDFSKFQHFGFEEVSGSGLLQRRNFD